MCAVMRHTTHSRQKYNKKNTQTNRAGQKCSAENVIVYSPTAPTSSEKKGNDSEHHHKPEPVKPCDKKEPKSGLFNFNLKGLENFNLDTIFDSISDDFILIALIVILVIERFNLKKSGADKNKLSDYDMMIVALVYLLM